MSSTFRGIIAVQGAIGASARASEFPKIPGKSRPRRDVSGQVFPVVVQGRSSGLNGSIAVPCRCAIAGGDGGWTIVHRRIDFPRPTIFASGEVTSRTVSGIRRCYRVLLALNRVYRRFAPVERADAGWGAPWRPIKADFLQGCLCAVGGLLWENDRSSLTFRFIRAFCAAARRARAYMLWAACM